MRQALVTSLLLFFPICLYGQDDLTLAEVLRQNFVAFRPNSVSHLSNAITSYATLSTDREFLIAYYLSTPQNELHFPLFLARLNKQTGEWDERSLTDLKVNVFAGTKQEKQYECLGSALRLEDSGSWYYLDLHWTPSAGCLVVLNRGLTVHRTLTGWSAGLFNSGLLVYEGNMVHFAPVHPATLFLYDPHTGRSQQIYPPENDPFRKNFSDRLAEVMNNEKCRANNWPCDASDFGSAIDSVEVSDATRSLAFRVDFETEGFLTREEAMDSGRWNDNHYVYIYRLMPSEWREFTVKDLKPKFGTDSLDELLTPEKLRLIFATPQPQ